MLRKTTVHISMMINLRIFSLLLNVEEISEFLTMETLLKDLILEFNPDTLNVVRKEVNMDNEGRINEAIDLLDEWVKKQSHFVKKDFSRSYLERFIITNKGSVERAKNRLDKLCTLKTLMPNFFTKCNVKSVFNNFNGVTSFAFLPKLTTEHHRVFLSKLITVNFDSQFFMNYYKVVAIQCEYLKLHDYCNGIIVILDLNNINILELVTKLSPLDLRQALTLFMEGYGLRISGFHFLTPSKMIGVLITVFKQVLSSKMANRLYVHTSIDSIHKLVPKNILPSDYGGSDKSLVKIHNEWMEIVGSENFMEYLKEMNKASTNEAYRRRDSFNEQYLGMPGSFRTLSVD